MGSGCRDANAAWLQIVMTATDLIAWTKLIGFAGHPKLARCEVQAFRYRVLQVAADSPTAPDAGSASTPPGAGHSHRHRLNPASAPRSPNTSSLRLSRPMKDSAGIRESPPTGETRLHKKSRARPTPPEVAANDTQPSRPHMLIAETSTAADLHVCGVVPTVCGDLDLQ